MDKHLHIIAFTVPYPADYGGVFDLFYKLIALKEEGVLIHLHCFDYNRGPQPELNKYCYSVDYYSRNKGHKAISYSLPYIVASRKNELLFSNLLKDDYPILMEGIHSTYLLQDERFKHRKKYIRLHNVEHLYYRQLSKTASSILQKIFFFRESILLKKYEQKTIAKATAYWGVSHKDVDFYTNIFHCTLIDFLPVYLPENWGDRSAEGKGYYCLFHGDLSIGINEAAAIWLLEKVFKQIKLPLVIAGKNPSKKLERLAHAEKYSCLVANPSEKEMQDMITKAHINIFPAVHSTGIPIKILNALFNGKYCIVNKTTAAITELSELCSIANTSEEYIKIITALYQEPFTILQTEKRKKLLHTVFNNTRNAKQQITWIWGMDI